ncbi:protein diaphanous homolog 1-like [Nymphalis io]|uniref:protein diaphanous homolog 1-like n=1 Tax=Inachis io TaxID=171585 RepID=UPI002167026F|nr:protein diaphanous homolog 1-like [Nymphalis io]XP_050361288.1 protein diaphanous homolog 1-like [Nymphalis io]
MSNKNEQNGRQPPLPGQPPPSLENEANHENGSTSSDKMEICRNFVWGSCNKNTQCKFRHELDFEEMKKILKFCHDYQNPPGCTREHCTYLHTTKEEESLFFATGQLPRVLAERHANMSATAAETIPQIALFIQESFVGPPPPPPPPPAPASAPAPVAVPPPIAPSSLATKSAVPMMPMQQLPPPPPPPPPVSSAMPIQQHASVFPAPAVQVNPAYTLNTPPPPVHVLFDASRPPPPIPTKRPSPTNFDVQPKKRKVDEVKVADGHCDQCVQRDIRVESCKQEMEKLCGEEEYNTLIYKKKLEEYQNRKELLRSLVSNDLYRLIEEYVEGIPQIQVNDVLTQLNQTPFVSGTSSVPKQFLLQLMEYVLENSRVDAVPSSTLRLDESLLQSLSRRTNSVGLSSPDVLQTFMEILRQSNAPERVQATDLPGTIPRCTTLTSSTSSTNSSQRYSNGQSRSEQHVNRMAPPTPQVPPPPPPYHHYPAPPARLYYPPPFPVPPTSGAVATSQLTRVPPPPAPAQPPAPAPPTAPSCHPYTATRYPPPFYQRHQ